MHRRPSYERPRRVQGLLQDAGLGLMKLVYSPWMARFMRLVAQSEQEILLVSLFIKLSLVKPLLLAIPDSNLRMTVVQSLHSSCSK